jgi:hypothetical protein
MSRHSHPSFHAISSLLSREKSGSSRLPRRVACLALRALSFKVIHQSVHSAVGRPDPFAVCFLDSQAKGDARKELATDNMGGIFPVATANITKRIFRETLSQKCRDSPASLSSYAPEATVYPVDRRQRQEQDLPPVLLPMEIELFLRPCNELHNMQPSRIILAPEGVTAH